MNSSSQQLLIPMAGEGSRFRGSRWQEPKPLIDLGGVRMFELVAMNLMNPTVSRLVFVAKSEHRLGLHLPRLREAFPGLIELIEVEGLTAGPAETVLAGLTALDPDLPVTVANSDQFIFADLTAFFSKLEISGNAGAILLMEDSDPKWSFVRVNPAGEITEVREKEPISSLATIGVYGFKAAKLLGKLIGRMISANDTVNGEFYLGPAYNFLRPTEGVIQGHNLGPVAERCFGLGIPEDLEHFLSDSRGIAAVRSAARALST